jgi:hypothetical protein
MTSTAALSVSVEREIDAPADAVYDLVSDVTRMGDYSPENTGARWLGDATGPEVGARFKGTNQLGWLRWSTTPTITAAERGREFAFVVPGRSGATWTYRFEPAGRGVRVVESVHQERRSPLPIRLLQRCAGVVDREEHLRSAMLVTLDRLAAVAEASATASPAGTHRDH